MDQSRSNGIGHQRLTVTPYGRAMVSDESLMVTSMDPCSSCACSHDCDRGEGGMGEHYCMVNDPLRRRHFFPKPGRRQRRTYLYRLEHERVCWPRVYIAGDGHVPEERRTAAGAEGGDGRRRSRAAGLTPVLPTTVHWRQKKQTARLPKARLGPFDLPNPDGDAAAEVESREEGPAGLIAGLRRRRRLGRRSLFFMRSARR